MHSMSDKVFIDTNILLYAHDQDAGEKQRVAQRILRDLWQKKTGVLSLQVLNEFYVNAVRKLTHPLPRSEARQVVEDYLCWCVPVGPEDLATAFAVEDSARVSFLDALILAAAKKSGAVRVLSEDLNHGQNLFGVRIENPFRSEEN